MMEGVVEADMQGHLREGMLSVPSFDPCLACAVVRHLAKRQKMQAAVEVVEFIMRL